MVKKSVKKNQSPFTFISFFIYLLFQCQNGIGQGMTINRFKKVMLSLSYSTINDKKNIKTYKI
jgi:hypothetical protein